MGGSFEESSKGYEATLKLYNNWLKELGNPINVYEANSREANENLLLDTYMLVLTDKKNVTETRLPLDKVTGIIKNEILPIVDGTTTSREPIPFVEMSPTFLMNKKYEYSGGKTGIGPFALNNKNHVLTQLVNLMFKDNDLLRALGFTGLNGIKSQNERIHKRDENGDEVYDENGSPVYEEEEGLNILDWISAMINAHVDVAKDPYVIRLNVRQYTYNICNFLLRAGFGKNTFYFLPQAILKEMSVAYERADGIYGVKGGSKTSIINEEIRNIRNSYYRKYSEACAKSGVPVELDYKNGKLILKGLKIEDYAPNLMSRDYLIDSLQDSGYIDTADADVQAKYYRDQLLYSELFLQLNDLAQDMSKLVQLSQIDTKRFGGNFIEQDRFMYRLKSFLVNLSLFKREDVEKYFSDTFLLTKAINGLVMPSTIFQDIMLRSKQSFKNAVTKVLTLVRMDNVNDEALNKVISNELEGLIRWQFLNNVEGFDLYDMLYGPNSMSYRLANIKKDIIAGKYPEMRTVDGKIANKLLNHLTSLAKFTTDNYNAPAIIATSNVDESDKFLKQDLKLYWQELLESPYEEIRKFATDLIYYLLATTAGNFTKNGMWNLMPTDAIVNSGYTSFIDKAVKDFTEADLNYDNFFLNNWLNGKLVPTVETRVLYFDEEVGEMGTRDAFDMMYGNIRINNAIRNVPVVLNPYRSSVGKNRAGEPVFSPYVKVIVDRTTPEGVLLYKYVGYTLDSSGIQKPVYVITNKKGLNNSGRVVKEYDEYSNSVFDFNNIEGSLSGNRIAKFDDIIGVIDKFGTTDKNKWLNELKNNFNLVSDYLPSAQALDISLFTLGLTSEQTETYNQPATEHGDNIEITEQEANQFKFKDGFTVLLPFKLNEQQVKALLTLEDFVTNPKKYNGVITLTGYAGTGKSTLIGIFDQYLRHKYIKPKYSAPTHRANAVTKMNNPNAAVATLHSLFGLRPTIDLTDGTYDLRNLKNQQVNRPGLNDGDVLIIDESSMISKALYKFIEDFKKNHNVKIIYVGDDAQLSPVNDNTISPVFTGNQTKVLLTKVERTGDNAILAESTRLRNGQDFSYETRDNVEFTNSSDRANEVIDTIVNSQEFKENPLYFRILSATNDMIQDANNRVRRILFGENAKQIEVGDIMMGYNNILNSNDPLGGRSISNSIDYVVTEVSEAESKTIEGVSVRGYNVTLKEANADIESLVFVLDNSISDDKLQKLADAYKAINLEINLAFVKHEYNKLQPLFKLKQVFEQSTILMREFKDSRGNLLLRKSLDYGYAHTVHKSQGGTYNNVLIYADTIDRFNDPQVRQLLKYVAMSRAKDNVTVLTNHPTTGTKTIPESVKQTHNETLQILGGVSDSIANSEMKDAIKVAKEGISFESVLSTVNPIFTQEEIRLIKQGLKGRNLRVMSVSRYTDPAFFAKEIIKFLEENAKKPFTDPTRVNAIELWTKHDGEPIQLILLACKKYKVAPMVSFSITTLGNTPLEQGVLEYNTLLDLIGKLIKSGDLDPRTTTIRIDPILPGYTNMDSIRNVVNIGKSLGIRKYVTSLVQSYGYLDGTPKDRKVTSGIDNALAKVGQTYDWDKYYGRIPYGNNEGKINFKPKQEYINEIGQVLLDINKDPEITLLTCSFTIDGLKASACLDPLIIERVTGISVTRPDGTYERDTSRPDCMCYGCHGDKFRLNEKQCFSSCAYCYAAHSGDSNFQYYNDDGTLKDRPLTRVSGEFIGNEQTINPKDYKLYAEEWSRKEGWSVDYFNNKVLPKLDLAWQIEYLVATDLNIDSSNVKQANMNYDYGTNKRSDVTAENTLLAIKNGERTATTRYEGDQHIDFWKLFKTGDYLRFVKKDKDGNIVDSVLVLITKPATKLTQSTPKSVETVTSTNPKDYKLYSGGAVGSDTEWANVANQYGVGRTINYRPETLDILTPELIQEVETQYAAAASRLGRKILDANSYAGKLVRRDYLQAKAADGIFGIGHILRPGEKNSKGYVVRSTIPSVDGGTGYAVQMAMDLHKPVHVYDLVYKQWYKFDYNENTFIAEDTPTLTTNFAGIGTRQLSEDGKQAIRDVFEKTFGKKVVEQLSSINIYAGTGENADLSNFAIRPFNFKNMQFLSVEQAFLYYKWAYSSEDRLNEIIANKILLETSGANLRALGKQFKGLDTKAWDEASSKIMKQLIKTSFEQNETAKQRLLSTGDILLTHKLDKGKWGTEFPKLLMEVRNELSKNEIVKPEQRKVSLTSFSTFDESEIQSNSDVEQMNRDGEQIKNYCKGE